MSQHCLQSSYLPKENERLWRSLCDDYSSVVQLYSIIVCSLSLLQLLLRSLIRIQSLKHRMLLLPQSKLWRNIWQNLRFLYSLAVHYSYPILDPWVLHPLVSNVRYAFDFSLLILFTVVLSALHHQPPLLVRAWDRHKYHFLIPAAACGRVFGAHMKQKSRFKFLSWPGFEPRTLQSNSFIHSYRTFI